MSIHTSSAGRVAFSGRAIAAAIIAAACVSMAAPLTANDADRESTVSPVLFQPSMNVFRRHAVDAEALFEFYGPVLGFEQLETYGAVSRFQAGGSEFKLSRRVQNRQYQPGGVSDATGLRMLSFFFPDQYDVKARFEAHGYAAPDFQSLPGTNRLVAYVNDPDGQAVELVVVPGASAEVYEQIEVGLTVTDIERSREFYRGFVGLEELAPVEDTIFGTTKYSFRHGSTIISLRSFGADLPVDTGSGGIQYVVSNVDRVDELAKARDIRIDSPLTADPNAALRTVWVSDPDGITNYFAETTWSRDASAAVGR